MQTLQDTAAATAPAESGNGDQMLQAMMRQAQWFTQMWTDFAVKVAQASVNQDPASPPPEAARQARTAAFRALSQTADQYMRMPQFLQAMKQSMDLATACRKQMNEFLTAMHHNAQGIAKQDIDHLMLSVRHLETRVLEGLEQICGRMENLSQRVAALETGNPAPPPAPATNPAAFPGICPPSAPPTHEAAARPPRRQPKRPREKETDA